MPFSDSRPSERSEAWRQLEPSSHPWRATATAYWLAWSCLVPLVPGLKTLEPLWLCFCLPPMAMGMGAIAFPRQEHRDAYLTATCLWMLGLAAFRGVVFPLHGVDWVAVLGCPAIAALASEEAVLARAFTGVWQVPLPGMLDPRAWRSRLPPDSLLEALRRLDRPPEPPDGGLSLTDRQPVVQARRLLGLPLEASPEQLQEAIDRLRRECQARRATLPKTEWVRQRLELEARIESALSSVSQEPVVEPDPGLDEVVSRALASGDPERLDLAFRVMFHARPSRLKLHLGRHRDRVARAIAREDVSALRIWNLPEGRPRAAPATTSPAPAPPAPQASGAARPSNASKASVLRGRVPLVGHSQSFKYHGPGCPYGDRISALNRVELGSEAEAKSRGFRPCRVCQGGPYEFARDEDDLDDERDFFG
jgi:hypothetical protein